MPYYQAGDYYLAGDGNYAAGSLGSFLKGVVRGAGRIVGGAARTALGLTPAGLAVNALLPAPSTMQGQPLVPVPGFKGAMQRIVPGGETGYMRRKHRHMNAGNAKAARRAIRRIKSVRHMLQSIERELPHRAATVRRGSPGVITRAEAARALRA